MRNERISDFLRLLLKISEISIIFQIPLDIFGGVV